MNEDYNWVKTWRQIFNDAPKLHSQDTQSHNIVVNDLDLRPFSSNLYWGLRKSSPQALDYIVAQILHNKHFPQKLMLELILTTKNTYLSQNSVTAIANKVQFDKTLASSLIVTRLIKQRNCPKNVLIKLVKNPEYGHLVSKNKPDLIPSFMDTLIQQERLYEDHPALKAVLKKKRTAAQNLNLITNIENLHQKQLALNKKLRIPTPRMPQLLLDTAYLWNLDTLSLIASKYRTNKTFPVFLVNIFRDQKSVPTTTLLFCYIEMTKFAKHFAYRNQMPLELVEDKIIQTQDFAAYLKKRHLNFLKLTEPTAKTKAQHTLIQSFIKDYAPLGNSKIIAN